MADLRYQVQVDTRGAQQSLTGLQQRVGGIQTAFGGLRTAIAGVAFGAAVRSALGFAAAVNDTSTATNVARQSILGLGQALTTNGGQAGKATEAVQRFSLTMGQAAQGSKTLQTAFGEVGISLQDLSTLDESEILARTIEGLGAIEDSGRRAAVQTQIFGRTMQGVNAAGLAQDFRRLTTEQDRNAEAVRKAGQAQDKLNSAMNRFQLAVVRTLEPMVEAFNRLSDEQIATVIDGIVKLAAAIAALAVAVRVISAVAAAFTLLGTATAAYFVVAKGGLAGLALTVAAVSTRWGGFLKAFGAASGVFGRIGAVFTTLGVALSKTIPFAIVNTLKLIPLVGSLVARFEGLAVAVLGVAGKFAVVGAAVVGLNALIRTAFDVDPVDAMATRLEQMVTDRFPRLAAAINRLGQSMGMAASPLQRGSAVPLDPGIVHAIAAQKQLIEQRKVMNQLLDQETKRVRDAVADYQRKNAEHARSFDLQTRTMNMTEEQRMIEEAQAGAQQRYLDSITPMLSRMQEIRESGNATELAALPALQAGILQVTQEYEAQLPALQVLIDARLQQITIQKEQLQLEEQIRAAAERRAMVEQNVRDIILNGQKRIRAGYEELELSGLSGVERALQKIAIEERNVAEAARERVAAQFGDNDPAGLQRAMAEITRASQEITRQRQQAAAAVMQEQRSFAAGWRDAWAQYVDAATDASAVAANVFRTATKGMEDALIGFVKTGKFEFRSFVADILEQLLRARIQQGIASLGQSLGFGNLGGTAGSATGRGATPSAPLFVQDISAMSGQGVGGAMAQQQAAMAQQTQSMFSRMGEIMSSIGTSMSSAMGSIGKVISGLVGSLGSIMSSVMRGMGSALSAIGSMIMSMVRAIVGMFGGFFADGGVLPRGQFGIVGERGPEIITGPATVTPMSGLGGGTQVIYNINAVDARSFQQLLAQDPGLIFALTEQGRKTLAGSRR